MQHPISNYGNMLPFKSWLTANILCFKGELGYPATEGNREEDGEMGSTFWFSSQISRIADASDTVDSNVHVLMYEDGMRAVETFIHEKTGALLPVPHLNNSNSDRENYLRYYDEDLLTLVNSFPPFIKDCRLLPYSMIHTIKT